MNDTVVACEPRRGLALIIVIGILGVLAALAAAFVAMAQLERRASEQRVNAARAYLLARSGIEDALARLELGQDPAYGGEDWDASGDLNGFEGNPDVEVYRRGVLNVEDCPARHALRPSFFARSRVDVGSDARPAPDRLQVDGRPRGYSGLLAGDEAPLGNGYALKVASLSGRIFINGGALDAQDRDPDGPGAKPEDFPLNPNAAAEVAPLLPNGVADYHDVSMEGPNGFLVRLLDNLEVVMMIGHDSEVMVPLGEAIVGNRPVGGYKSLDELKPILGLARFDLFKPTLTLHAWVDPKVVKPQPMDGRPHRWEDIDDAHRIGIQDGHPGAAEISGYRTSGGGNVQLNTAVSGDGTETGPWVQKITVTNAFEGTRDYPVTWERNFVYAWSQLRLAPPALEPRAPVCVRAASQAALASVFLGLKGAILEVWDGSAGWDSGFGHHINGGGDYAYPSRATEETPWHRTRVDYGMTYGTPGRPWYGPQDYNPHASPPHEGGGKPVIQAAPLGRLRVTVPLSTGQAMAVAGQAQNASRKQGPFRTWARFNAFVDALPLWEEPDGEPYRVEGADGDYTRRTYRRGDRDSNGVLDREAFPDETPGLTFAQKDVLKAMANPNTDLNDFNPDANLRKEVDKTDLAGISAAPSSFCHTAELALDDAAGYATVQAVGRVLAKGGRLLARRQLAFTVRLGDLYRDTTQADFMRDYNPGGQPIALIFSGFPAPYLLSGGQPLVSYPEPQTVAGGARAADAAYDGQVGLGFIAPLGGPNETLRGALFDTAGTDIPPRGALPDLRGPFHRPLLAEAGGDAGNVFPDGVYSEKDRTLKYSGVGVNLTGFEDLALYAANPLPIPRSGDLVYVACWVKPAWFPEASPRAHALISFSSAGDYALAAHGAAPLGDIRMRPRGLYFVPARNNAWQDTTGMYRHNSSSTRGKGWPSRALLWGTTHSLFASWNLNRRGILSPAAVKPVGQLEGGRWQHLAASGGWGTNKSIVGFGRVGIDCSLTVGRVQAGSGGGWAQGFSASGDLRFGEVAAEHNMNYAADATFANVRMGFDVASSEALFFWGPLGPATLGRYHKQDGATATSPTLPAGLKPSRVTWTEIPCDLWFDEDKDGWLGDAATGYKPRNDRDGNGKRDVHIALEVWDDRGTPGVTLDDLRLARFEDAAGENRIPAPPPPLAPGLQGRLYYKAVFVNEWDAATRINNPLDVTPFLDDVTFYVTEGAGPKILHWEASDED